MNKAAGRGAGRAIVFALSGLISGQNVTTGAVGGTTGTRPG